MVGGTKVMEKNNICIGINYKDFQECDFEYFNRRCKDKEAKAWTKVRLEPCKEKLNTCLYIDAENCNCNDKKTPDYDDFYFNDIIILLVLFIIFGAMCSCTSVII